MCRGFAVKTSAPGRALPPGQPGRPTKATRRLKECVVQACRTGVPSVHEQALGVTWVVALRASQIVDARKRPRRTASNGSKQLAECASPLLGTSTTTRLLPHLPRSTARRRTAVTSTGVPAACGCAAEKNDAARRSIKRHGVKCARC